MISNASVQANKLISYYVLLNVLWAQALALELR